MIFILIQFFKYKSAAVFCKKVSRDLFRCLLIGTLFYFVSCRDKRTEEITLFTKKEETGINFKNTVIDNKTENSFLFRNY